MKGLEFLQPAVRIVMPIHNALFETRRAIESIAAHTHWPFRLSLFDDGSETYCHNQLKDICQHFNAKLGSKDSPKLEIIRQSKPQGFVFTVNRAFAKYSEEFTVIINSDVMVTPYWLTRMVLRMLKNDQIACLMPLSNQASFHSFSIPPGWNAFQLAENLAQTGRSVLPVDLVTAVGFCLLLRRSSMPQPLFDPKYSPGYGEESHLSMWLNANSHKVQAATDVFIHHCGQASFPTNDTPFMESENYRYFMKNWQDPYHEALEKYHEAGLIAELRQLFPESPAPDFRSSLKLVKHSLQQRGLTHTIRQGATKSWARIRASLAARGWRHTVSEVRNKLKSSNRKGREKSSLHFQELSSEAQNHAQVVFLFEELNRSGGVQLILALCADLIARGIDARIAVHKGWPVQNMALWRWPFEPVFYESPADLKRQIPSIDLAVSTLWSTTSIARELKELNCARTTIAFIQDQEDQFYTQSWTQQRVIESYQFADETITTSPWLQKILKTHNVESQIVRPGLSLDDYFPDLDAATDPNRPLVISAIARPQTPRRGFRTLLKVFKELENLSVQTICVGSEKCRSILKNSEVHGFLAPKQLRKIYQRSDLFIDFSTWQAFGLPAFEAMACGATVIAPLTGGFANFAEDGKNALLCDTTNPEAILDRVRTLIEDRDKLQNLQQNSLELAQSFSLQSFFEQALKVFRRFMVLTPGRGPGQQPWTYRPKV